MDPREKTPSLTSNDAQDSDNGVPEEFKFITLVSTQHLFTLDSTNLLTPEVSSEENACETSTNKLSILPKIRGIRELSISATQTPLTLTKLTLIQSSSERQSVESTIPSTSTYDPKKCAENAEPLSYVSNLNEMSIKISREATTQATPPHPSLLRRISTSPGDTSQTSTSLCSSRSGPKSEILTVTTDYGNQSPDAHSILVDAIDQSGNSGQHFSMQEPFGHPRTMNLPPLIMDSMQNDVPADRTNSRRWSLNNCFRCTSAINDETDTLSYMRDAPPTYSTIYANHTTQLSNRIADQSSFVAPTPPPSYAQAEGISQAPYSMDHFLSSTPGARGFWTPRPTTAICPRCLTIVITVIEVRQSRATHVAAFALFLCGCWPCCVIPYCANSCKNIDHYCPICRAYLGTYRPW